MPPTDAPSPEPWKVALAERLRDASMDAWIPLSEALALISKHHDPSCPGPTPTRTEREDVQTTIATLRATGMCRDGNGQAIDPASIPLERAVVNVIETIHAKYGEVLVELAERKALEVKP